MSAMLCLVISAHQVVSSCPRVLPRFVKSEGERRSGGGKVRLSQLTGQRSAFSTNSRLGVDHPAVVLGELRRAGVLATGCEVCGRHSAQSHSPATALAR